MEAIKKLLAESEYLVPVTDWPRDVPSRALMICGYKRTGKDTFARDLRAGNFAGHEWTIYARRSTPASRLTEFAGAESVAFADALRRGVYGSLDLPSDYDYEVHKDQPIKQDPGVTVRDCMIALGDMGRTIDGAHWVKRALLEKPSRKGGEIIFTDFRFPAEYYSVRDGAGIDVVVVRLFRSEIPVPPAGISSEHDLDAFETDFLLVRSEEEFSRAVKIFRQYANYVQIGTLGRA